MTRGTFVYRNGELVLKNGPKDIRTPVQRSSFPSPMLISDSLPDLQSMVDGKRYDSKSALRASYKRRGVVELGNDAPTKPSSPPRPRVSKAEVAQALAQVKQGYKPRPMTRAEFEKY